MAKILLLLVIESGVNGTNWMGVTPLTAALSCDQYELVVCLLAVQDHNFYLRDAQSQTILYNLLSSKSLYFLLTIVAKTE